VPGLRVAPTRSREPLDVDVARRMLVAQVDALRAAAERSAPIIASGSSAE